MPSAQDLYTLYGFVAIFLGTVGGGLYIARQYLKLERELEERAKRRGEEPTPKATLVLSIGGNPTPEGRQRAKELTYVAYAALAAVAVWSYAAGVLTMTGFVNPPLPISAAILVMMLVIGSLFIYAGQRVN